MVGGAVRDALLGLPPGDDLDLVVEGDPGRLPGWSAHDRFGTAVQAFPEGTLHIGMARRERYPAPGALPVVAPALDLRSTRVAGEVRRLLEEEEPEMALRILDWLGVPWASGSHVRPVDDAVAHPAAPEVPRWAARLGAVVGGRFLERAALPGWAIATAQEWRQGARLARALQAVSRPSEVDRILRAAPPATQAGALAAGADVVERWWERDRDRRADIDGSDLVAAGIAPGPAIGRALAAVRAAVLDGAIENRESQLQLALRVAREHT